MPTQAGPGSPRPRARDDRRDGLVGVLPDRGRHRRGHQGDGHPLRVPGLGGRLARLLPDRHLRRRPGPPRPAVRAVHEPDARRAARHRHRRGVGAPRGRLRHGALAPRRRPRGLRRHDRHVPGALGRPRGRQGARPARRRARGRGEGVPAHLGQPPPRGDRPPPGAPRHQPAHAAARAAVPRGRAPGRLPAPHRAAPVRHRPVEPRAGRPGAARAERERPPDDPGRQGRRRAARLPEARRPGHPDALVDAPRPGRDRADHRREGRPGPDRDRRHPDVRADPRLGHARLLPDRVARPARAAPEAPAHPVGGPDRRHLAVPSRAGEVRHDPAVPAPPDGHGGAGLHPSRPAPGAQRDARRDRLPRAGDPGARRDRRLRPDLRRPHPAPPGPTRRCCRRSAPTSWRRRRRAASTGRGREGVGRGGGVRELRVLQGARGGVRGARRTSRRG